MYNLYNEMSTKLFYLQTEHLSIISETHTHARITHTHGQNNWELYPSFDDEITLHMKYLNDPLNNFYM